MSPSSFVSLPPSLSTFFLIVTLSLEGPLEDEREETGGMEREEEGAEVREVEWPTSSTLVDLGFDSCDIWQYTNSYGCGHILFKDHRQY